MQAPARPGPDWGPPFFAEKHMPTPSPRADVRIGIGGWTYAPWRRHFYPADLPQRRELAYASRQLTAIEVNGTFYSSFAPSTFARWHDETPPDFVFSLKAPRYATHRKILASAGESVRRFLHSGVAELGPKLGPIVWQFLPLHALDARDFEAFLQLLPPTLDGLPLRHTLDVRHPSFDDPAFLAMAHAHGCAVVATDSDKYPALHDTDGAFAYLRLMRCRSELPHGYPDAELDAWAAGARAWTQGNRPRDVFIYFIDGAKEQAPAAAMALLQREGMRRN